MNFFRGDASGLKISAWDLGRTGVGGNVLDADGGIVGGRVIGCGIISCLDGEAGGDISLSSRRGSLLRRRSGEFLFEELRRHIKTSFHFFIGRIWQKLPFPVASLENDQAQ